MVAECSNSATPGPVNVAPTTRPEVLVRVLEADRSAADQPVHDGNGRAAVLHRELALEHDVADPPAPARETVVQVEVLEQFVAGGRDRPVRPFMHTHRPW